jgi:hypothetical protein
MADFSMLKEIPDMYHHCKETEDKDMTPFDFITDHLVNIDGIFDKHDKGDEQKPHQPIQIHHNGQTTVSLITYFVFSVTPLHHLEVKKAMQVDCFIASDYISKIFRPPILA